MKFTIAINDVMMGQRQQWRPSSTRARIDGAVAAAKTKLHVLVSGLVVLKLVTCESPVFTRTYIRLSFIVYAEMLN